MRTNAFFKPAAEHSGQKIALQKPVSAIQVFEEEDGSTRLGLLLQLGPGTPIERCGEGFNKRTVKVRANGHYYFMFLDDLEAEITAKARAQSA